MQGYKPVRQMVFCGMYPVDGNYTALREALEKMQLNDAALSLSRDVGCPRHNFRCGSSAFCTEIIQERLEREFQLNLISTAPSVVYRLDLSDGRQITSIIDEHAGNDNRYDRRADCIGDDHAPKVRRQYQELCQDRRGVYHNMDYLDEHRVSIHYDLPLNEIIYISSML